MKLADVKTDKTRPHTPIVPMTLTDNDATRRLVAHAAKRVIAEHKHELTKLAYR